MTTFSCHTIPLLNFERSWDLNATGNHMEPGAIWICTSSISDNHLRSTEVFLFSATNMDVYGYLSSMLILAVEALHEVPRQMGCPHLRPASSCWCYRKQFVKSIGCVKFCFQSLQPGIVVPKDIPGLFVIFYFDFVSPESST